MQIQRTSWGAGFQPWSRRPQHWARYAAGLPPDSGSPRDLVQNGTRTSGGARPGTRSSARRATPNGRSRHPDAGLGGRRLSAVARSGLSPAAPGLLFDLVRCQGCKKARVGCKDAAVACCHASWTDPPTGGMAGHPASTWYPGRCWTRSWRSPCPDCHGGEQIGLFDALRPPGDRRADRDRCRHRRRRHAKLLPDWSARGTCAAQASTFELTRCRASGCSDQPALAADKLLFQFSEWTGWSGPRVRPHRQAGGLPHHPGQPGVAALPARHAAVASARRTRWSRPSRSRRATRLLASAASSGRVLDRPLQSAPPSELRVPAPARPSRPRAADGPVAGSPGRDRMALTSESRPAPGHRPHAAL